MNDFRARLPRQQGFRQQPDQVITFDETAAGVEEEAAVEIAIPGQPQIGAMLAHRLRRGVAAFRQQGIGNAVRERAVRLVVNLDEPKRQMGLQRIDDRPRATVAGVDHDLQRLERAGIDIAQQMGDVGAFVGPILQAAAPVGFRKPATRGQIADGEQAAVAADRLGLLAHQLHAVVIHRIVAGGDHDSAVETMMEGGEINLLGAARADVHHIRAAFQQPLGYGRAQRWTAQPHVVAHRHLARPQQFGIRPTDAPGQILVQFVGNPPANVIRLETRQIEVHRCAHVSPLPRPYTSSNRTMSSSPR